MAIADLLQHVGTLYYPTSATDAAGGTVTVYLPRGRVAYAGFPVDGAEQLRFAQQGIVVTKRFFTESSLAQSGDKFVDEKGVAYLLHSIATQESMGDIDEFDRWVGEQLLPGV